ncbi:MAG TPA: DNA recombination protein RmuC [Bacteroidales bacterium]|nr:DNA recombination protein RmuC [Bacteroidales bacterium]HPS16259.1 DNA recombination protein RmuC [Bacteroidales bacterium]
MEILYIIIGIVIGIAIGWLLSVNKNKQQTSEMQSKLQEAEMKKISELAASDKAKEIAEDRYKQLFDNYNNVDAELKSERIKSEELGKRISKAEVEYRNLLEKLNTQKAEMDELQKKFSTEFENIANKILKTHSQEFTQTNLKNIGEILTPLKEKIGDFEKKVNEAYDKELRDKYSLREEVKKLYELNSKISNEANNLTKALKGDSKKQGNWGELVLDKIMERSGLTRGAEYETQYSTTSEDGKRIQPDVVVFLPDKKHIIIDSKVSLVAYEHFVNTNDDAERQQFLKEHINSIRTHIKGLSEKNYQSSKDLNSPDFVLLFIPIESSFGVAVQQDQQLFSFAWDNKIVIVTPSTLLATLKTISSIWKQENQTRNAMEIARQGGALYDKFVGFVNDLEKVGKGINLLHETYDDAMKKLQTGSGNLINKVESIRKLGIKTSKQLPEKYNQENGDNLLSENNG